MADPYRFPGIADFIAGEGVKPSFAVKIPGLFFVGRVVDALAQIPTAEPRHRGAMYAVADEGIAALKAAVVTVEAAYLHVLEACPIPEEPKPEPVVELMSPSASEALTDMKPKPVKEKAGA